MDIKNMFVFQDTIETDNVVSITINNYDLFIIIVSFLIFLYNMTGSIYY